VPNFLGMTASGCGWGIAHSWAVPYGRPAQSARQPALRTKHEGWGNRKTEREAQAECPRHVKTAMRKRPQGRLKPARPGLQSSSEAKAPQDFGPGMSELKLRPPIPREPGAALKGPSADCGDVCIRAPGKSRSLVICPHEDMRANFLGMTALSCGWGIAHSWAVPHGRPAQSARQPTLRLFPTRKRSLRWDAKGGAPVKPEAQAECLCHLSRRWALAPARAMGVSPLTPPGMRVSAPTGWLRGLMLSHHTFPGLPPWANLCRP